MDPLAEGIGSAGLTNFFARFKINVKIWMIFFNSVSSQMNKTSLSGTREAFFMKDTWIAD